MSEATFIFFAQFSTFPPTTLQIKKPKRVSNREDSKAGEKLPRKETLQCLKRSFNRHVLEMCLKLQERSRS